MGTGILAARQRDAPPTLRIYAACTRGHAGTTLLALNLDAHHSARLSLPRTNSAAQLYLVTAPKLLGRQVRLNRRTLQVGRGGAVPATRSKALSTTSTTLPPTSYAFVTLPGVGPAACH